MGGSSQSNGSLELLVPKETFLDKKYIKFRVFVKLHRKVMGDDNAGMGEGLNEMGPGERPIVVRGTYRFGFSGADDSTFINVFREFAKEMFYIPILKFSNLSTASEMLNQVTVF